MTTENNSRSDKQIELNIETTQGKWETSFPKTAKIEEVLNAIISHFGFSSSGNYTISPQNDPDTTFKPERPLVSYGIEDDTTLIFSDMGVAV